MTSPMPGPGFKKYLDDNPCHPQHDDSLLCLSRTGSKSACRRFFDEYNECMKQWRKRERERKLAKNRGE